ncbi:MAG: DUF2834 domain-containing protein [Betaproteobacteria bacterium]|nr:DUF2834 domain-containing protein [Betaproteobacteria bacterium]
MFKPVLWIVLIAFSVLSAEALWQHGYLGLWRQGFVNLASLQLLADLLIVSLLAVAWMWRDARRCGRNPWPYALITLAAGSFGTLLYLLLAPRTALPRAHDAALRGKHA